jgi:hypothetical protein
MPRRVAGIVLGLEGEALAGADAGYGEHVGEVPFVVPAAELFVLAVVGVGENKKHSAVGHSDFLQGSRPRFGRIICTISLVPSLVPCPADQTHRSVVRCSAV